MRQMSEVSLMDVSKKHVLCIASLPGDYQLSSPLKPIISQAANGHMLYLKGGYCLALVREGAWGLCQQEASSPMKPVS